MPDSFCYKFQGTLYFQKRKIPKKRTVLKRLGVKPGTFAGGTISRLYDYYFNGAVDFVSEYNGYYSREFDSAAQFIEEKYNIEHEKAIRYAAGHYSMKECSIRAIERNIETLIYDEEIKSMFSEAVGGIEDEDPNGLYY